MSLVIDKATVETQGSSASAPESAPLASASLYVGELDPSVTEAMLFEMFNIIGPVSSIRVCRDAVTRRSLGYAYVNFHRMADAERALETLNYSMIKGRSCRIMWSQRDPSLRKGNNGNIFIKNLDPSIDHKALHDTFSAFGNILSCKIANDEQGNSKGYGFVHYETLEAAESAIKSVNGMLLNDRKVFVGHHISRKERESKLGGSRVQFTNIYVKNIPFDVTDEELSQLFGKYGIITSCVITRDDDGTSKGFGFVNFEKHQDAQNAVDDLHKKDFRGQDLYVSRAQKKNEREEELRRQYEEAKLEKMSKYQGVNLYVKNLDDDMDDDRLRDEFSVYGVITSAKIMRDEKTNISRGFGFVCFTSPEDATRAVTEMNGRIIGSKPIYVAIAQRKEVRRSQLEIQMAQRNQLKQAMMPPSAFPPTMYGPPAGMAAAASRSVFQGAPMPSFPAQGYPTTQRLSPPPQSAKPVESAVRPLTAQDLDSFPLETQRQMLGERLYPLINAQEPEYAGKITGMLLEMDKNELLQLLEDKNALYTKVQEAATVLKEHLAKANQ
ncbi:hypothetical protein G6F37_002278 [Rhizopus arrhizus]|nr:hypothetical protein G6F38_007444 [Rhizopus arrhizus]KAG1162307.1 hypothetical protein G6F37_002278 [Rhizopus arrhizus]